jgi:hypothetical protein
MKNNGTEKKISYMLGWPFPTIDFFADEIIIFLKARRFRFVAGEKTQGTSSMYIFGTTPSPSLQSQLQFVHHN